MLFRRSCFPCQGNSLRGRKPHPQTQNLPQTHIHTFACSVVAMATKTKQFVSILCYLHSKAWCQVDFSVSISYIPCFLRILMLSQMIAKAFCFPSSGLGPFHLGIPSVFPSVLRTPPPHMTCVPPQLGLPPSVTAFCSYLTPKCPVSSGLRWLAPFCSWLSA